MSTTVKQSLIGTVVSYLGVALGMINRIFLFPLAFVGTEADYWGLLELFVVYAAVISNLSNLGRTRVIQRYLPGYQGNQRSLLSFAWKGTLVGGMITMSVLLLFRSQLAQLSEKPELFSQNYLVFFLILIGMFSFEWSASILIARFRTHIPMVFNQFILRFLIFTTLITKWLNWISAVELIYIIGLEYLLVFSILFYRAKKIEPNMTSLKAPELKNKTKINEFSWYAMANGTSSWLFQHADSMVMGAFSLTNVAILSVAKNIANSFFLPGRSLVQSLTPVVAKASQEMDRLKLLRIYRKSSMAGLFVGGFIFLLIWAGIDILLIPLQKFSGLQSELKWVVLLIGIGRLSIMSMGLSSVILANSDYYKFNFLANISLIAVSVVFMLLLIPSYGLLGAAVAQGSVMVCNMILRVSFIKWKLKLFPYQSKQIVLLFIFLIGFATMGFQWSAHIWISGMLKVMSVSTLFLLVLKFYQPVPEITDIFNSLQKKFSKHIYK